MKVYAINDSVPHYTRTQRNNIKPATNNKDFSCPPKKDVSFGNGTGRALKWVITAGSVVAALINPALLGVICLAGGAGYLAGKIAEVVAMEPNEQKNIAENGKDAIDDIIKDSFPY